VDGKELVEGLLEFVRVLTIENDVAGAGGEAVLEGIAGDFSLPSGVVGPRDLAPLARAVSDLRFDSILVLLIRV